jgi:hypothetical protein
MLTYIMVMEIGKLKIEPMNIERGKFYKTRGGDKVEVLSINRNNEFTIVIMYQDGSIAVLLNNGRDSKRRSVESDRDLVSEWVDEPSIPREDYPSWFKWIAMDSSGSWYGYITEPKINNNFECWDADGTEDPNEIPQSYCPTGFVGDWTTSKFRI